VTTYRRIKGTRALVSEDQYQELAEQWRGHKAAQGGWSLNLKFESKTGGPTSESGAGADSTESTSGQFGGAVSPDYADGGLVAPAGRPLVLAQVLRQEETSSNLVRIVRDIQDTDGTAEGDQGAAYGVEQEHPEAHDWRITDTTSIVAVTEDFMADVPNALSYLTKRLAYLVQRAEETNLVTGNGTFPAMLGLLAAADGDESFTALTAASYTTSIGNLIAQTYDNSGLAPEWIAMSATTWLAQATETIGVSGNNEYLAGHANTPGPRTLWGLPVIWSNAVPTGTVVVGSSAAVGRWVHTSGLRVEMSTGYSTYFGEGLVAVRGKIRSTLAYEHPSGVGVLTVT
jgi:HK97 family phage major capsid protein